MKGWVKLFNQYDLYTKKNLYYCDEEISNLKEYYTQLIEKYLPKVLYW